MNPLRIATITDWLQVSPWAEFSLNVVEELTKRGDETFIVAPEFSDEKPSVNVYKDGQGVLRYTEETTGEAIVKWLLEQKVDVLLVHTECFSDKRKLELIIKEFTTETRRSYLFIHSEKYDMSMKYSLYTGIFLPSRSFQQLPPGNIRVSYIDQGIPHFDLAATEEETQEFRRKVELPVYEAKEGEVEGYYLSTFAGKTDLAKIIQVLEYINTYNLVKKPVYLFVQSAKEMEFPTSDYILPSIGYLPADMLAAIFHHGDGSIFIYPEINHGHTSASIRFAVGAGSPVITNRGRYARDFEEAVITWATSDTAESIKHAIVSHFTNLPFRKNNAARIKFQTMPIRGWNTIGQQLFDLLHNKLGNRAPANARLN